MKIEIWSDIMCPFCYIGKRRFEQSLKDSPYKDQVEVEWKSYQLSPELLTDTSIRIEEYLSVHKGIPLQQAKQLNEHVTQMAAAEGLSYNFDISIVANSFKAHVLAHFAKQYGRQDEAEELLFKGYFTEGKNIDDVQTLKDIAIQLGLDPLLFEAELSKGDLDDEVKKDIHEARQIGVSGVPFFVYDRKYAVSGAQAVDLFQQTLSKAMSEFQQGVGIQIENDTDADSCDIDGC